MVRFASRCSAIQDLNIALAACLPGEGVGTLGEVDMGEELRTGEVVGTGEEGGSPPPLAALRWRGSMSLFIVRSTGCRGKE
jgi:hypothetical protein